MKIFISTPSFGLNGGIRNIIELANGLKDLGHDVVLYNAGGHLRSPHYKFKCRVVNSTNLLDSSDLLILSSPHSVHLGGRVRTISWVQMLEERFRPHDNDWLEKCLKWYQYPSIYSATWGKERRGKPGDIVLPTGISLKDFPITNKPKDGRMILLESPEPNNPAKDVDFKALKAAAELKKMGYYILAYGAKSMMSKFEGVPNEYYASPPIKIMNNLYECATILLKATKCDFQSVSCLEAMTKGCVSVRGIDEGDELLTEDLAYVTKYDGDVLQLALTALNDPNLKNKANNCRNFIKDWKEYLPLYEKFICEL